MTSVDEHRSGRPLLRPEKWREDLLRIVLWSTGILGSLIYVPSVYEATKHGLHEVIWLDTAALAAIVALLAFDRMPVRVRAACGCLVFYLLGAGLLINVGSISQIYLFGFSLLTTLLLTFRWGVATVVLNAVTMVAIGWARIAAPEMAGAPWAFNLSGWLIITGNFAFVNASLVLALGSVLAALESALARAVTARAALERDRTALVTLNESLALEVRERARSEESLRTSRALLRIAGRSARLGGWQMSLADQTMQWSDEVCELLEIPAGSTRGFEEVIAFYTPEFRERMLEVNVRCIKEGAPFDQEVQILTARKNRLWVRVIGNASRDAAGVIIAIHGSAQDITQQKRAEVQQAKLEEQLRQAQKMESFGHLAGGVAHDFNNLMSVVLSYSELLIADLKPGDAMRADLDEIRNAGRRATELTRQLLAFSRRQVLAPKILDLSDIVRGMEKMLRRVIGEDVELAAHYASSLGKVLVDPGQMEQVIMNLAVNARDAMPRGGMLTIEATEAILDEGYAAEHVGVSPGPHVMLAVSDTGVGMDKATQARLFEPFFTTKEPGKGTGLGLATVFGIVRQSGGTIWVYSEPGKGTTFKIYFPLAATLEVTPAAMPGGDRPTLRGTETILLVEDEERIRVLARTILRKLGYEVLEAQNGSEALVLSQRTTATIHLLLTDVVMPRMSGRELAEQLGPLRPQMKVLYMSGYTDDAVVRHGILSSTLAFLQKPITPEVLARRVREVLDG